MDRIQCCAGARRSWVTLPGVCLVCGQKLDWSGLRSRRDGKVESTNVRCSFFFSFVLRVHLLGCHLHFFKNLVKSIHLFEENQT